MYEFPTFSLKGTYELADYIHLVATFEDHGYNVFIRHYSNSDNMHGNQETFFPFNKWSNIKGSGIDDKSRINCLSKNVLRKNKLEQDVLATS